MSCAQPALSPPPPAAVLDARAHLEAVWGCREWAILANPDVGWEVHSRSDSEWVFFCLDDEANLFASVSFGEFHEGIDIGGWGSPYAGTFAELVEELRAALVSYYQAALGRCAHGAVRGAA
jgi:hypothetical protein